MKIQKDSSLAFSDAIILGALNICGQLMSDKKKLTKNESLKQEFSNQNLKTIEALNEKLKLILEN